MEPVSIPTQRGTLEDPEILQNVPGHVIPILQREFDDFKTEATRFLDGDLAEEEFIKFRLKQGVYGQRQPDVQMIRVKLPFGGITPEQMEKFADVIEKYVPLNRGHITTRQNIQMHHVPLLDAEKAIRELGDAGLSSREGCGNTMRNVTGDPWAGVARDELFDLTPYAGASTVLAQVVLTVEDAQAGLHDLDVLAVVGADEVVERRGDARHDRGAAADPNLEAPPAIADPGDEAAVVNPSDRTVVVGRGEGSLELAGHQLADVVADEVPDVGAGVRRRVEGLAFADPGPGVAGDVAHRVAAALA